MLEKLLGKGRSASAGSAEYPPKVPELGEPPVDIDMPVLMARMEAAEHPADVAIEEIDRFYNAWAERGVEANLFSAQSKRELWEARKEAVRIAEAYEAASEQDRQAQVLRLADRIAQLQNRTQEYEGDIQANLKKLGEAPQESERLKGILDADMQAASDGQDALSSAAILDVPMQERDISSPDAPPDTPREAKERLGSAVRGFEKEMQENEKLRNVRESLSPYKVKMQEAQESYITEYKKYHAASGRLATKARDLIGKEPEALKEARSAYRAAQLEYNDALMQSRDRRLGDLNSDNAQADGVTGEALDALKQREGAWLRGELKRQLREERLGEDKAFSKLSEEDQNEKLDREVEERLESLSGEEAGDMLTARDERLQARYERLIRFREVIQPEARAKIEARKEALGSKEKGIFSRAGLWIREKQSQLEQKVGGRWRARLVMAAGVSAVLAAGSALATGAVLAAAGWGVWRTGRALAGMAFGTGMGTLAGQGWGAIAGMLKKGAEKQLKTAGRKTGELTEADLQKIIAELEKLEKRTDQDRIDAQVMGVSAAVAVLAGSGFVAVDALGPDAPSKPQADSADAPPRDVPAQKDTVVVPDEDRAVEKRPEVAAPTPAPEPPIPQPSAAPAPAAPEEVPMKAEAAVEIKEMIHENEGADHLFFGIHAELERADADSPVAQKILGTEPRELARELGFADETSSKLMTVGDTVKMDDGQLVFIDKSSGDRIVLIEKDGTIPEGTYDRIHTNMLPHEVPPLAVEPQAPVPEPVQVVLPPPEATIAVPVTPPEAPSGKMPLGAPAPVEAPVTPVAPEAIPVTPPEPAYPAPAAPPEAPAETPVAVEPPPPVQEAPVATEPPPRADVPSESSYAAEPPPIADSGPAAAETPGTVAETFTNRNGIPVYANELHLYGVPGPSGTETLIAFGESLDTDEAFVELQRIAQENPGKTIYFQSPVPTTVNGVPQQWVASATYTPQTGFAVSVTPDLTQPGLVGARINPETFTKLVR